MNDINVVKPIAKRKKARKVNLSRLDNLKKDLLENNFTFTDIEIENNLSSNEIMRKVVIDNADTFRNLLKLYNPSALLTVSQLCYQLNKKYSFNLKVDTLSKWLKPVDKVDAKPLNNLPQKYIMFEVDADNNIANHTIKGLELNDDFKSKIIDFVSGGSLIITEDETDTDFLSLDVSNIKSNGKGKY
jgi:hypothetical protein